MSDFKVGDTIYHHFSTRAFATGIPTTLINTPVAEAYEEASATGITAGVSLTIDHAETGHHLLKIVATGGNSFETGAVVPEIHVEICSACHPFYTGKQKFVDSEGRVDRFRKRYAQTSAKS